MADFLDIKELGDGAKIPSPTLCIVLLTYQRTALALHTIQGVCENLDYPNRTWYIADDGSSRDHIDRLVGDLNARGENLYALHNEALAPRPYCGRGWNHALRRAHDLTDYVLWLEDDWHLDRPLDIRPYVRVLLEREDVGMITMRGLSKGLRMEVAGHNGIHYFKILREGEKDSMAYSGNPLIRHTRYLEYGLFPIDETPGDCEIVCDHQFRHHFGPDIWRPAEINGWGIWGHCGTDRMW